MECNEQIIKTCSILKNNPDFKAIVIKLNCKPSEDDFKHIGKNNFNCLTFSGLNELMIAKKPENEEKNGNNK